ncbi:hypothetical protein MBANPS3_003438 [Mucor bainieri]
MSASAKSLPNEVLLKIFIQVNSEVQLAQCRLVCRSWGSLVEKAMYKVINLSSTNQLARLSEHVIVRPTLGSLIQKLCVQSYFNMEPTIYDLLELTPNLKILEGHWDRQILLGLASRPEGSSLKLEQLPCIEGRNDELNLKTLFHFKEALRSAAFTFNCNSHRRDRIRLGDSLDQFKKLQKLTITDDFCFSNVRDLDHLLRNCNQLQELKFVVLQDEDYIHAERAQLKQWLAGDVERVETIKSLKIDFEDDSLEDEERQPYEYGPDWMEYLAYKYPNHIILPELSHIETFNLKGWKFYGLDDLKRFINMLATQDVYIECKVDWQEFSGDPYICSMSAIKENPNDCTSFSIQLPCDGNINANTVSVLSLFSARFIKKLEIDLSENGYTMGPICASMNCGLNVDSFKITTASEHLGDYPQQPIFTGALNSVEIVGTAFSCDFITQLGKYAANLTHLKLVNCSFQDKVLMPSTQLASLALHSTNEEDMIHLVNRNYPNLLFRISTTKCPEQTFLASPRKPLQQMTKEAAQLLKTPTIHIECGSLKHLSVNLADFRFEMEFDNKTNLIKSVDSGMEDASESKDASNL